MIGSVATVCSDPGGGPASLDGVPLVDGALLVADASFAGFRSSLHAAISVVAAAVPTPSRASLRSASLRESNPST